MGTIVTARRLLWLVPSLLYLGFWFWYTGGGKLSEEEVAHYLEIFQERGVGAEQLAVIKTFMEEDTGRQFFMLNAIDMADAPVLPEGAAEGSAAQELMAHYMEYMYPSLFARACHPIFAGGAIAPAMDLVNAEGMEVWDTAALMRYRTRRDMLEISTNPVFSGRHDYKLAALDKTIAYPAEALIHLGDPRLLLFLMIGLVTALLDILLFGRRKH